MSALASCKDVRVVRWKCPPPPTFKPRVGAPLRLLQAMIARVAGAGSLYATLSVDPAADETAIRRAYKKLAFELHPDRNKAEGAEEAFKKVVAAHERLVDPQKRRAYDLTLRRPLMPVHVPAAASNTAAMASMAADADAFTRRCAQRVRAADAAVQQLQQLQQAWPSHDVQTQLLRVEALASQLRSRQHAPFTASASQAKREAEDDSAVREAASAVKRLSEQHERLKCEREQQERRQQREQQQRQQPPPQPQPQQPQQPPQQQKLPTPAPTLTVEQRRQQRQERLEQQRSRQLAQLESQLTQRQSLQPPPPRPTRPPPSKSARPRPAAAADAAKRTKRRRQKPRDFWAAPGAEDSEEEEDDGGDFAQPRQKPVAYGQPGFYSIDSLESQFSF